ncbi:MAG TPA: hypothetical protein IAB89_09270 [Candidatus Caccousia avicola]|uniref:Uncharacterized protein n=1 Tax=Candidatus Caccousia avicola TaxID=2840721 RepID=A0A9D1ANR5_9FIRM|nr:hypothetical protein [Candidatus Caccousia avicola]
MYINSKNKQLQLEPLRGIITQGEKLADTVTFALPNVYGNLTLSSLGWSIRAASEKNTLATASLTVSVMEDKCLLSWEVSSDFTAVSGALSLMLVGTDGDGKIVIKFPGDSPIWVRDSETGEYSPPEDAIENALNGLQSAEEALKNAIEALQSIGVNLKILGWYPTLEALQAAVKNPSPGDIYGIGDPTVLYVWTGSAWTQLPGVFVQPSGFNFLVNSRFAYNSRNQQSYTAQAWTVDGWFSPSGSATITLSSGVTVTNAIAVAQPIQYPEQLFGKQATFSVKDADAIYTVTATMPSSAQGTDAQIAAQATPWGDIAIWNISSLSAFAVVISVSSAATLEAAKLELGATSTLAADLAQGQDEAVEQLRLDMYDLDPGRPAYILTQNENLLDNWYFVGGGSQQRGGQFPINQRGQTSYTGSVYGIDRWRNLRPTTTIQLLSFGLQISDTSNIEGGLVQYLESNFSGKKVTLSLLISQITGSVRLWARNNSTWETYGNIADASSPGLLSLTADITDYSSGNLAFYLDFSSSSSSQNSVTITAAKLELGTRSTLARLVDGEWALNDPPPNFQQELAKCQRYQVNLLDPLFPDQSYLGVFMCPMEKKVYGKVFCPVSMRSGVIPTVVSDCSVDSPFYLYGIFSGGYEEHVAVTKLTTYSADGTGVILRAEVEDPEKLVFGEIYTLYITNQNARTCLLDANL